MPAGFDKCMNTKGHKVRTVTGPSKHWGLETSQYMHLCILGAGENLQMYRGEKHTKKEE